MATSVDNRVVSMSFDNVKFEQAIGTTLASLGKLTAALSFGDTSKNFGDITNAASKVDLSSMAAGTESVSLGFVALLTTAINIFNRISNAAIDTGIKIAKALTINGMVDGFAEYELKMGSIQTIMAGSGESLEEVNKQLEVLNKYSDETIYSFKDMTSNIGKFTNQGISLEKSVAAIKGVANVAALSGSNAQQAANAMYNFSQSLAAGSVKLIDWKSIENAGMATKGFKKELLETGVAAGTVRREADGMYSILSTNTQGKKAKVMTDGTKNFNSLLEYQWMTADVLTDTLGQYSDATTDIGAKATKAATEVKTFSQMIATMKESVGSGWAMSFEHIFGDKNQAVELWTSINDGFSKMMENSTNARNAMLKLWNTEGGRDAFIEGLSNVVKSLGSVFSSVGKAFREVFPPTMGVDLIVWSKRFKKWTESLKPTPKLLETITDVFRVFFKIIKFGFDIVGFVIDVFKSFFKTVLSGSGIIQSITGFVGGFAKVILGLFAPLDDSVKKTDVLGAVLLWLQGIFEKLAKPLSALSDFINNVNGDMTKLGKAIAPLGQIFSKVAGWISNVISSIDFGAVGEAFLTILTGGAIFKLGEMFKSVGKAGEGLNGVFKNFSGFGSQIKGMLNGVTKALGGMQNKLNAQALKELAIAIAILAASLLVMSLIEPTRLAGALAGMATLMTEILAMVYGFSKMGPKGIAQIRTAAASISAIAIALVILSLAVAILGKLDPLELAQGLIALGVLMTAIGLFTQVIGKGKGRIKGKGMVQAAKSMILFGVALMIMAKAVKMLGTLDPIVLAKGLGSMALLMGIIAGFTRLMQPKRMVSAAIGMVILSTALLIMTKVIKDLGSLEWAVIGKGLTGITGALTLMIAALWAIPKDAAIKALGMLVMSAAILILSKALTAIGSMKWAELAKSLVGLGVALALIAAFLTVMSNPMILVGAAGLVIVSGALIVLAGVLKILASLSIGDIVKALGTMAVAFAIIGVAGYALIGALPGLLGLAAALIGIGVGVFLAGAGINLFALGIAALGTALAVSGGLIVGFLISIAEALPKIFTELGKAVGAFALSLAAQGVALTKVFSTLIGALLDAIIIIIPKVVTVISLLIDALLTLLVTKIPAFVSVIFQILTALLTTLEQYVPVLVAKGGNIITSFIDGMSANMQKIIDSGAKFITNLITGIGNKMLEITETAMDVVIKFVRGLTAAINKKGPEFDTAAKNLLSAIWTRITKLMTGGGTYDFTKIGKNIADGIRNGITGAIEKVKTAIKNLVDAAFTQAQTSSDSHSPSRLFMKIGKYWVDGVVVALKENTSDVTKTVDDVVMSAYKAMALAGDKTVDVFGNLKDPVITPVIDLDNVTAGAKAISSLMSQNASVSSAGFAASSMTKAQLAILTNSNKSDAGKVTETKFVQNNYSPKPLSRLEIYRQTTNQLNQLKLLGVI